MKTTVLLFQQAFSEDVEVVEVFHGTPSDKDIDDAMHETYSVYKNRDGHHWTVEKELKVKDKVALISDHDDGHALYINGKLKEDGPDTTLHSVIDYYGIPFHQPYMDEEWRDEVLYETGCWPQDLKDVKVHE